MKAGLAGLFAQLRQRLAGSGEVFTGREDATFKLRVKRSSDRRSKTAMRVNVPVS
jgi:hypothetical protein